MVSARTFRRTRRCIVTAVAVLATSIAATGAARAATTMYKPVADTFFAPGAKLQSVGHARVLKAGRRQRVLLRFRLGQLGRPISRATLRLTLARPSTARFQIRRVRSSSHWKERSRRAPRAGRLITTARAHRGTRRVTVDVTSAISGRRLDLMLLSASKRPIVIRSRETRNAPTLTVDVALFGTPSGGGASGEPAGGASTPISSPATTPSPGPTATPAPVPTPAPETGGPTADFAATPLAPVPGQEVTFDGGTSDCQGACTYTWSDDGPDGPGGTNWPLGTGKVLKRSFTAAGDPTKYVRLTVRRQSDGATAEIMKPIVVQTGSPAPGPTPSPTPTPTPTPVPSTTPAPLPTPDPVPEPTTASVFLAPTGSDANPCTAAAPCASFDRGYQVAQLGQVVELATGSYSSQDMSPAAKSGSGTIVFRPAAGASVTVDALHIEGPSNVTFRDFSVGNDVRVANWDEGVLGSHDVTLRNLHAQTVKVYGKVANVSVLGGDYGNTVDWQPQIAKADFSWPDSDRPSGILIDGVNFHDFTRSSSQSHTECLQVLQVNGLTVRNSRFNHCDGTGDIGITDGPSDDVTFENNFMGKTGDAFYSMQITKNIRHLVLRNNSASKAAVFSDTETGGPYIITGNYMPYSSGLCDSHGVYSHNVFAGGTCGGTDLDVPAMRFVNEDAFDLHLAANSEAIDHGDPNSYPAIDIDRQARPTGGAPDAGADER